MAGSGDSATVLAMRGTSSLLVRLGVVLGIILGTSVWSFLPVVSSAGATPLWSAGYDPLTGTTTTGVGAVNALSCVDSGDCVAGGYYIDSAGIRQAFLAQEVSGVWQTAVNVTSGLNTTGAAVSALSCSSVGACTAVGYYGDANGSHGFAVTISGGSVGSPVALGDSLGTNSSLVALACADALDCTAVGQYVDASGITQPMTVSEASGTWASPVSLSSATGGQLTSVACSAAGSCVAGGYTVDASGVHHGVVYTLSVGAWDSGTPVGIAGDSGSAVTSISCAGSTCEAGGYSIDASGVHWGIVADGSAGWASTPVTVAGAQASSVSSVACTSTECWAAGSFSGPVGSEPFVASSTNAWTGQGLSSGSLSAGTGQGTSLACVDGTSCVVGGSYAIGTGAAVPFTSSLSGTTWGDITPVSLVAGTTAVVTCDTGGVCAAGGFTQSGSAGTTFVTSAIMSSEAPVISGTAQVNSTLTASTGTWPGSPASFTYSWERCPSAAGASATLEGGCTSVGTAPTYTVGSLDTGSYLIVGVAPTGSGAYWSESTVAVLGPPSSPSASVTASNLSAFVTWSSPASDGGSSITGYTVTASPGGATCSGGASSTSCTLSGLTNGTTYTISVAAVNAIGTGAPWTGTVTPTISVPWAPTSVVATSGDTSVSVSWAAPVNDGGSTITNYTVTASPGGATCTSSASSCVVSGLTNGTPYSFSVTATNSIGTGPAASASSTPAGPPLASASVSGTATDGAATVTWSSADNQGSPIISYAVTSTPSGYGCQTGGSATSCSFNNLPGGVSYTFTVTATNALGTGPGATSAAVIGTIGVPTGPQAVAAAPENGSSTVSWTAPANDGGAVITGYTVTASPGTATCSTTSATSCTLSGLTNGTTYTLSVTATNSAGTGPAVGASVTPATTPSVPLSISASTGNGDVTVSWAASADDGGSPIMGYHVSTTPGGENCATSAAAVSCTMRNLTNGTTYTFDVTAVNAMGAGAAGAVTAMPVGPPGAPQMVRTTFGDGSSTVTWAAPASDGGSPITGYTVTANPGGATCSTTSATSCTLSGLTNGTPYTVNVTATNVLGTGPSGTASVTPAWLPASPSQLVALSSPGGATLSWAAGSANGSVITGYMIAWSTDGVTWTTVAITSGSATSYTVGGLNGGTAYTYEVSAINAIGTGSGAISASCVAGGPPEAVASVTVAGVANTTAGVDTTHQGSLDVSWSSNSAGIDNGYTATASPGGKTCASTGTDCVITGLTTGVPYTVSVVASNAAGTSPSTQGGPGTPTGAPGTLNASVRRGDAGASVNWTVPASDGGRAVSSYAVQVTPSATCASTGLTSCSLSGLTNGTVYTISVAAVNAIAAGPASVVMVTPAGAPGPATHVTTSMADGVLSVTWTAANDNGAPVTYDVTTVPASSTCVVTSTSCTIPGLRALTRYTVVVSTRNAVGTGTTVQSHLLVAGRPGVVTSGAASGRAFAALVSWTPETGGAVTGYRVTALPHGPSCTTTHAQCVVRGLVGGASYRFSIVAINSAGAGLPRISPMVQTTTASPEFFVGSVDGSLNIAQRISLVHAALTLDQGHYQRAVVLGYGTAAAGSRAGANLAGAYFVAVLRSMGASDAQLRSWGLDPLAPVALLVSGGPLAGGAGINLVP